MRERLIGALLTACLLGFLFGLGFAGSALFEWLGRGFRGADPGYLSGWSIAGYVAGVAVASVVLLALGSWFIEHGHESETSVDRYSPREEYVAAIEFPRLNSIQVRMARCTRFQQSLLDRLRPASRIFRASGRARLGRLTIDVAWTGPRALAVSGSLPSEWKVEKARRRWRDVAIEYRGDIAGRI